MGGYMASGVSYVGGSIQVEVYNKGDVHCVQSSHIKICLTPSSL